MAMREIDLNVTPTIEEFDDNINKSTSTSMLQTSSSTFFPFDLNDDIFMEDDTPIEEIMPQSNLNTGMYISK